MMKKCLFAILLLACANSLNATNLAKKHALAWRVWQLWRCYGRGRGGWICPIQHGFGAGAKRCFSPNARLKTAKRKIRLICAHLSRKAYGWDFDG